MEIRSINENWLFYYGDENEAYYMGFDDRAWRRLSLPHDWAVEFPFDRKFASGTGYLPGGTAWYRKRLILTPADCEKRLRLCFDGVYKHAKVWFNSNYLGPHAYGYTPFSFDVTAFARPGENVIAVRVEHNEPADSRWYTGSGIYRDVTLTLGSPFGFAEHGVFPFTLSLRTNGDATLCVDYDAPAADAVRFTLTDGAAPVAEADGPGGAGRLLFAVPAARLWSPEDPFLYTLRAEALKKGTVAETRRVPVGIRTAVFDPKNGFFLNGVNRKLKGVCLHHDAGALGAAVPAPVWERRLRLLKDAGCNAVRTAHNPPSAAFLDICDRLGLMVMDEAFDEWEGTKNKWTRGHNVYPPAHYGYAEDFPEWHERDLRAMIARDRRHPCVILWSIGNEIDYPNDPYVTPLLRDATGNNDAGKPAQERKYDPMKPDVSRLATVAARLVEIAHAADATRPALSAMSFPEYSTRTGFSDKLDVFGYNYRENRYTEDHAAFPNTPILGSENGHAPAGWNAVLERPYIAGQFLWTGIDFLGECRGWPERISQAGLLDLGGFPKPLYYQRKALWTDAPFVRLAATPADRGHANVWTDRFSYAGTTGEPVCVSAYTNVGEAELFVNGRSLGKKTAAPADGCRLTWEFPYETGEVTVRADNHTDALRTPGDAAALSGRIDDAAPDAQYKQVVFSLTDAAGAATTRDEEIRVQLCGPGELLGIENGAPDDLTPYAAPYRRTRNGRLIVYVKKTDPAADVTLYAFTGTGLKATLHL